MYTINEQFKSLVRSESEDFPLIIELMFHSKKTEGKRFINLMNNVVNYYLQVPKKENEINLQIIHVPSCEPWARELFLEFLIHKTALFKDTSTLERFKIEKSKQIYNNDNKEVKKLKTRNQYYRTVCNAFKDKKIPVGDGSKNLIIYKETDLIASKTDKNPWISNYYIGANNIDDNSYNLCLDFEIDAFTLEKRIKKCDHPILIENVFIFHVNNSISRSYCINQLNRLNQYGTQIKNCFIFSFSKKPFRLNEIIESVKKRFVSTYYQKAINKYNDFQHFVNFTIGESDYLFYRDGRFRQIILDSPDRTYFTNEIETFIENIENNINVRNHLALCWGNDMQYQFSERLVKEIPDFKHEMCIGYYTLLKQVWQSGIIPLIENFIEGSEEIAFIVEQNTPPDIKRSLINLFHGIDRKIKFFTLEKLNPYIDKGSYINSIPLKRIILMRYKSPNGTLSNYPNSFDSKCLNKGQKAIEIINTLTHGTLYEWDCYWYYQKLNGVLYSTFREDALDWKHLSLPHPQSSSPIQLIDEDDNESIHFYPIDKKCRIIYKNDIRIKEISFSENVIYKTNDVFSIAEIKDLFELKNISLQLLDEIALSVRILITEAIKNNNNAESIIRNDPKYELSEEEIVSTTELWRILLKHKVDKYGAKNVYEDVFHMTPEKDKISIYAFNQWYNLSSSTVLPRSKKDQKSILKYLGFEMGSAYHRIICTKKLANINGTKRMNLLIENLLKNFLFIDTQASEFCDFQNTYADILTLLKINSYSELKILKELLLQELKLKPVERFDYDKE